MLFSIGLMFEIIRNIYDTYCCKFLLYILPKSTFYTGKNLFIKCSENGHLRTALRPNQTIFMMNCCHRCLLAGDSSHMKYYKVKSHLETLYKLFLLTHKTSMHLFPSRDFHAHNTKLFFCSDCAVLLVNTNFYLHDDWCFWKTCPFQMSTNFRIHICSQTNNRVIICKNLGLTFSEQSDQDQCKTMNKQWSACGKVIFAESAQKTPGPVSM